MVAMLVSEREDDLVTLKALTCLMALKAGAGF